jgi:hypothetical protein
MNNIDRYGRVINQYGQEMGYNNYYPNWNIPDIKSNPCSEIDLPKIKEKEKENKHKYILIRR